MDAQLKRMVQDLKEIIEHLNASGSNQDSADPVRIYVRKLNLSENVFNLRWKSFFE